MSLFNQGDLIEVDFDPTRGHEPAKRRPALVVSTFDLNIATTMTIVCPITSNTQLFFLHEPLPDNAPVHGVVVMEQVRAIDLEARPTRLIGRLDQATLHRILVCLRSFFAEDALQVEEAEETAR